VEAAGRVMLRQNRPLATCQMERARDAQQPKGKSTGAASFPPPWSAEESEACFIVRDAKG